MLKRQLTDLRCSTSEAFHSNTIFRSNKPGDACGGIAGDGCRIDGGLWRNPWLPPPPVAVWGLAGVRGLLGGVCGAGKRRPEEEEMSSAIKRLNMILGELFLLSCGIQKKLTLLVKISLMFHITWEQVSLSINTARLGGRRGLILTVTVSENFFTWRTDGHRTRGVVIFSLGMPPQQGRLVNVSEIADSQVMIYLTRKNFSGGEK